MSRRRLVDELLQATAQLSDADLESELAGILPPEELAGLAIRIRVSVERITTILLGDQDN